jgi:hypothetical protein
MNNTKKRNSGYALIMALLMIVVVAGYVLTLHTLAASGMRSSEFNAKKVVTNYLVEGGLEGAQKAMQRALADYQSVPSTVTYTINGTPVYVTVQQAGLQRVETDTAGVRTIIQPYLITATATYQGTVSTMDRVVDAGLTPIFQFAVFYTNDLEMLPGANLTITGRIHTNGNMYVGSHALFTLNSDYVHAVGSLYQRRKDDGSLLTDGSVRALIAGTTNTFYTFEQKAALASMGIPSVSGFDSAFRGYDINGDGLYTQPGEMAGWATRSQTLWNGTVKTGENGLTEVVAPTVQTIEPYMDGTSTKAYYHANAGLVIHGTRAYVGSTDVTASLPSGTISQKTMYNGREKKTITVTEVDVAKLNGTSYFPSNGLLYAFRDDSTPSTPNGIRLKNASTLKAGLTVVSPDPVYTLGDYNSVNKKPAAIMTDAMNILSNAWNDTKTAGTLPVATTTTVNAAFITGNTTTTPGAYNGGLENLPRFHENWTNVSCNIRGSFVNTFCSDVAMGKWVYGGDNYTAPIRNWDYDTNFNNFNNLPPYTPYVVIITRVVQTNR